MCCHKSAIAVVEKHHTKYPYKVNFTKAAHICRIYLRLTTETDSFLSALSGTEPIG